MKTKNENQRCADGFYRATELLPYYLRSAIRGVITDNDLLESDITDIRLRRDGICSVSVGRRSYPIVVALSAHKLDELVFSLCGGSVYAHAETIRDGYINCGGIRVGVCGRAVTSGDAVISVCECSSVCIRIPHDVTGCADVPYRMFTESPHRGMLIYSPPGVGKTTLLRDMIRLLGDSGHQFAVIDSRGELGSAAERTSADVLTQYPKSEGIRSAVRSLSPELIICDELSGKNDAEAALYAVSSGVPLIATTHAGSRAELLLRPDVKTLIADGAFGVTVGISRKAYERDFVFDINETA